GKLRRSVHTCCREWRKPGDGGQVHDMARPLGAQKREGGLRDVQSTEEVHCKNVANFVRRALLNGTQMSVAGVVYHNVESIVEALGCRDGCKDRITVADIKREYMEVSVRRGKVGHAGSRSADDNVSPGNQFRGQRATKTAGNSSNEPDFHT